MRKAILIGSLMALGAASAGYAARGVVANDEKAGEIDRLCLNAVSGSLAREIAEEKAAGAAMRDEVARLQEQVALLSRIAGAQPGRKGQE